MATVMLAAMAATHPLAGAEVTRAGVFAELSALHGAIAYPGLIGGCNRAEEEDEILREVSRALMLESSEAALRALEPLEPRARQAAADSPNDAHAQFRLAAVMGARLDHESGTAKVSGAKALHGQLLRVLELSPGHAGASYIMGRLHVGVMRLDRVTRFLATQLLGGDALRVASWEEAQSLLELAAREQPCVPEHHFELARLYARRGNMAGAERELAYVRELTTGKDGPDAYVRAQAERLEKEWRLR